VAAQALDQQWVENLVRRNQELEKENEQLRERLRT
jgi:regulator of replication initiation timing